MITTLLDEFDEVDRFLKAIDPGDLAGMAGLLLRRSELTGRLALVSHEIASGAVSADMVCLARLEALSESSAEIFRRLVLYRALISHRLVRLSQEKGLLDAIGNTITQPPGGGLVTTSG